MVARLPESQKPKKARPKKYPHFKVVIFKVSFSSQLSTAE